MGCSSSKRIEATVDVYRPSPTSFAVFDISAIDEPWMKLENDMSLQPEEDNLKPKHKENEKPTLVPAPILEKLTALESDTPHSWDEVSKALEDLKQPPKPTPPSVQSPAKPAAGNPQSFRTVAELDAKLSKKPEAKKPDPKKPEPLSAKPEARTGFKPLKENVFLVKDREEREREVKAVKYDPLSEFPEKCPPRGGETVVVYTTSLRGVRRTREDCERVKAVMEGLRVVFEERDVALHGEFLREMKEMVGEEASVPRVFVKGRYIGGAEEVVAMNEMGKLRRILRRCGIEMGVEKQGCEGCGGVRFVPCLDCGGSCKVIIGGVKERCGECNENGLVLCPACH